MIRRTVLPLLLLVTVATTGSADAAPRSESALSGVVQVSGGLGYTCALLSSGQVRCWGDNQFGQLGDDGAPTDQHEPVPVVGVSGSGRLTGVTQISAGEAHVCAALQNGTAVCWGANDFNQLAGPEGTATIPQLVRGPTGSGNLTGVRRVTAGERHSCALLASGQVRCWGANATGAVGDDTGSLSVALPKAVRNVAGTGPLTDVAQVDAGGDFTCATLATGRAVCWGLNDVGQLGIGQTGNRLRPVTVVGVRAGFLGTVTQVSAGQAHACARLANSRAICWGGGSAGQLGDGTTDASTRPGAVASRTGDADLAGVAAVEAGSFHTCAVVTGAQVRCWGANDGALGTGFPAARSLPSITRNAIDSDALQNVESVGLGNGTSCAVLANSQLRCWGANDVGQLGNDDTDLSLLPVVVHLS